MFDPITLEIARLHIARARASSPTELFLTLLCSLAALHLSLLKNSLHGARCCRPMGIISGDCIVGTLHALGWGARGGQRRKHLAGVCGREDSSSREKRSKVKSGVRGDGDYVEMGEGEV